MRSPLVRHGHLSCHSGLLSEVVGAKTPANWEPKGFGVGASVVEHGQGPLPLGLPCSIGDFSSRVTVRPDLCRVVLPMRWGLSDMSTLRSAGLSQGPNLTIPACSETPRYLLVGPHYSSCAGGL